MREITLGVIHCADTPKSMDIGREEIDQWHEARGFKSPSGIPCGYHDILRRDATWEKGRPHSEMGAHARGHNSNSISACVVGGKGGFNFTDKQLDELWVYMDAQEKLYPNIKWVGHNELDDSKPCPCFDVQAWRYGK